MFLNEGVIFNFNQNTMELDDFMKDYLWIVAVVIIIFTIIIAKILNTNIDPDEIEQEDEYELNKNNTDENT